MEEHIELIISSLAKRLYDRKIMDNRERGDYAEELVAEALGKQWKWVGIGWHPWDFEGNVDGKRIRIQVKQSAARQIWQRPKRFNPHFSIETKDKPSYVERDHLGILIEDAGRFCEIIIFAWHGVDDIKRCDHRAPNQWIFFVVPEKALAKMNRISIDKLESDWLSQEGGCKVSWNDLKKTVIRCSEQILIQQSQI